MSLYKGLNDNLICRVRCRNVGLRDGIDDGTATVTFWRDADGLVTLDIETEPDAARSGKHVQVTMRDQEAQSNIAALMLGSDKYADDML